MDYRETALAWTPDFSSEEKNKTRGKVKLFNLGQHIPHEWVMTGGGCYTSIRNVKDDEKIKLLIFIDFCTLVVRDKLDPQIVHQEFLKLKHYRKGIPYDMGGQDV